MGAKDENRKKVKSVIKGILCLIIILIILLCMYIFYDIYFDKNISYAKETTSEIEKTVSISNAKKLDLEEIIEKNTATDEREEYSTQEEVLEYLTTYKTNKELPKGMVQVVQEGRSGKQKITIKKTYKNEELISEEQISAKVTKASINKIVEIGGANYTSSYKVKVGDTLYVTSDRLSVMLEPDEASEKIATLSKNDELKLTEIANSWYKISCRNVRGYVKAECTTYINPNKTYEEESSNQGEQSKASLISQLSFGMALNKPSGLSLNQFKKVLTDSRDTNKIFENNSEYFYYIEKQYNINGLFVAAVGIHESAWGTSKIARDKNNLFGYGAYDSNPYNGAYSFSDYSESIDLIARVLVKYYLNPKGTSIYGGEQAVGTYYNGPTLSGVNTRYATDKNWANGVFTHMKYLYDKL